MIRDGDASCLFVCETQKGKPIWAIPHAGVYRPVLYSRRDHVIITVMPDHNLPVSIQALSHHQKGERESNALMQASANS